MREMSTDRPDQTESPHTVDAGHFQVEMDLVNATFDRDRSGGGDVRTEVWEIAPLNLKLGLLNHVDIQFVLDTHVHSRVEDRVAGTVDKTSGFGDLQTRLKINLWGNDGYDTEFVNSITFSHDILGTLGGYVEFFSVVGSAGNAHWQGQADVGFTYAVNDHTQLDFGCNFGVTKSAPDFQPFLGLTWRY